MPYHGKKIAVVMPAYNAEKTLISCYNALPKGWFDLAILVDDASSDRTAELARTLPLIVEAHTANRGYGGNQKSCYKLACEHGADIAVMVHPDHQYDPRFIPEMIRLMADGGWRAVFGSRMMIRKNALAGGMPRWKYFFNILLTKTGNLVLGTRLTEFHSGFRAYDCSLFREMDIEENSDNFVFDTQIIIQLVARNVPIKEVPISTRYFKEASQISLARSIRYGLGILYNLFLYKTGLKKF
jgi:glycosyltransferase involved in cell wall biosynthesis